MIDFVRKLVTKILKSGEKYADVNTALNISYYTQYYFIIHTVETN